MAGMAKTAMGWRVLRASVLLAAVVFLVYTGSYVVLTRGFAPHAEMETNRGKRVAFRFFPREVRTDFMGAGVRTPPREEEWCFWLFYPLIVCDESLGGWVHEWRVEWNFRDPSRPAARIG